MISRASDEDHRSATPLELFFDLCFVVAVSFAANELRLSLLDENLGHAVMAYISVFFAIWWAWMNFTWFASAYDNDDSIYRITTLVQITGALILAAGIPRAFEDSNFDIATYGYVVMRLGTVAQWIRASIEDPTHRATTTRYAIGVAIVQVLWVLRLGLTGEWAWYGFAVLVVLELAVPAWAERRNMTTWHPRHITERYGLFTLIVLGESVAATTMVVQSTLAEHHNLGEVLPTAFSGLVIVFAMWWLYFQRPSHDMLTTLKASITWGYGHYFIFAAAAAVGTSLEVAVESGEHGSTTAGVALAITVGVYLMSLWFLQIRHWSPRSFSTTAVVPIGVVLILLAGVTHYSALLIAIITVGLVVISSRCSTDAQ